MKLLILTQAVDRNDPLGFFHRWIEEFAKQCERVSVVCLKEGTHALPSNVHVYSLGKEEGKGKVTYVWRFFRLIMSLRPEYDVVFVHMNPEYVVLGGSLWRMWGKKVGLWYLHKSITWKLRIAEYFVDYVFTAAESGMRVESRKKKVVGHGIDTEQFAHIHPIRGEGVRAITVGRVAPSKNLELQFDALALLAEKGVSATLRIVGGPALEKDEIYEKNLHKKAATLPLPVVFEGFVPHEKVGDYLKEANIFLNTSRTGGVDKAVLEAMAAGLPVVTTNEAFRGIVPDELIAEESPSSLAATLESARTYDGEALRATVIRDHSLPRLVGRISRELSS